MIWLTWRQFRTQGIVAACALGALAITLAVTGLHLAALGNSSGLNTCGTHCGAQAANFINAVQGSATELVFYGGAFLLYAVPVLIGIFWGAPLVTREVETGTYRLAWTQSVTRGRWVAAKLGLLGLAAIATAGLLSLMTSWWAGPLYRASQQAGHNALSINRLAPPLFGATGIVPISYAAFAFALGVFVGVLVRRTLPAMAITLAVFAAIQILWPGFVRPHLISPVSATQISVHNQFQRHRGLRQWQAAAAGRQPERQGRRLDHEQLPRQRGGPEDQQGAAGMYVHPQQLPPVPLGHGVKMRISYEPASRYWTFQWLEAGIFLVLALGLGCVCLWRIRRLG